MLQIAGYLIFVWFSLSHPLFLLPILRLLAVQLVASVYMLVVSCGLATVALQLSLTDPRDELIIVSEAFRKEGYCSSDSGESTSETTSTSTASTARVPCTSRRSTAEYARYASRTSTTTVGGSTTASQLRIDGSLV